MKFLIIFLSLSFTFLVSAETNKVVWDTALLKAYTVADGVSFKLAPASSDDSYGDLSRNLTVFFISVDNNSDQIININFNDFLLSNESNRQLRTLHPDAASDILSRNKGNNKSFLSGISIGVGKHVGGGVHVGGSTRVPDINRNNEVYTDVYELAVYPGDVIPGKKLEGLVYFKKVDLELKKYEFDIAYTYKDNPGIKKQITFNF